jgi:hypothetical protein
VQHPVVQQAVALVLALLCEGTRVDVAQAARPFVVDDARVVDPGACQVESWFKRNPSSHELWALPACNVRGFELTAGAGALHDSSPAGTDARDYQFQLKSLLREIPADGWGIGYAVGAVRHADINLRQNLLANYYGHVLASRAIPALDLVLLTSVGGIENRQERRAGVTWGVGAEYYLRPSFLLLAETYGATGFDRFAQMGTRWWLVPDHVQVDASYGWQLNGIDRTEWVTIGLRLISKPFF